jgi:hypothetical protein
MVEPKRSIVWTFNTKDLYRESDSYTGSRCHELHLEPFTEGDEIGKDEDNPNSAIHSLAGFAPRLGEKTIQLHTQAGNTL